MMENKNNKKLTLVEKAWTQIFNDYNVLEEIKRKKRFEITSEQIGKYKEARLMAKFDDSEALPEDFRKNNLNILPITRGNYIIGDYQLFEKFPKIEFNYEDIIRIEMPKLESIDFTNISSEATAINAMIISGILDDFTNTKNNVATINGRMGSGEFSFNVLNHDGTEKSNVIVKNAQIEIDGGLENVDSIIIIEGKNVMHNDFHIRQLFYPYRRWKKVVNKPIRLVFMQYINQIFRLFEYQFTDLNEYNSIELVNYAFYSFQDTKITFSDIDKMWEKTKWKYDDGKKCLEVPFIQANSLQIVIDLLQNISDSELEKEDIGEIIGYTDRQTDYYYDAGIYLELFDEKDKYNKYKATNLGISMLEMDYKDRVLVIASQLFKHKIFHDCYYYMMNNDYMLPSKNYVADKLNEYEISYPKGNKRKKYSANVIDRRASTVRSWLKWFCDIVNEE